MAVRCGADGAPSSHRRQHEGKLHRWCGDALGIGSVSWRSSGARPAFFAPAHIGRRNKEWGPGVLIGKAMAAGAKITASIAEQFEIDKLSGPATVEKTFVALVNNQVPPSRGLLLSMQDDAGGDDRS